MTALGHSHIPSGLVHKPLPQHAQAKLYATLIGPAHGAILVGMIATENLFWDLFAARHAALGRGETETQTARSATETLVETDVKPSTVSLIRPPEDRSLQERLWAALVAERYK
jgi:hypothetical protein